MFRGYLVKTLAGLVLLIGVSGCQSRGSAPIPPNAMFGTEGAGRLAYTAPEDGTLHIYDMSRNELVFAARVQEGQAVVVDPGGDRITIDGHRMLEGRLGRGNRHSIHLVPDHEPQPAMGVQREPQPARDEWQENSDRRYDRR